MAAKKAKSNSGIKNVSTRRGGKRISTFLRAKANDEGLTKTKWRQARKVIKEQQIQAEIKALKQLEKERRQALKHQA